MSRSSSGVISPPVVILHRPQMGENIGACARVMANFGFGDLRLVAPRDGWPNAAADTLSAGAFAAGVKVGVFDDIAEAIADLRCLLAASARSRILAQPVYDAAMGVEKLMQTPGGIVFGAENCGLPNEIVALSAALVRFPTVAAFPSLNLSHAVAMFCHGWASSGHMAAAKSALPARMDEMTAMLDQLDEALTERGYFFPSQKSAVMRNNMRSAFVRAGWTSGEVGWFRGVIKSLTKNP